MKIAILTPSRERMDRRRALVESIASTVASQDSVRLYLGVDDDDPTRLEIASYAEDFPFVRIVEVHNGGRFMGLGRLWNVCAAAAGEDVLAMVGDDMVFRTTGWDEMVLDEFSPSRCQPDMLKLVHCRDGLQNGRIAVNSFIHRRYAELVGHYARQEFEIDYIDRWLHETFKAIDRVVYRDDILIEHMHWSIGKMVRDGVVDRMRPDGSVYSRTAQVWRDLEGALDAEIKMLRRYIQ